MDGSMVPVSYLPPAGPPNGASASAGTRPAADSGQAGGGLRFGDILSALNPLQYLPVVGTIYRAVTGDTIPEGLRVAGSFVVSALTGGPFGLLLNAAVTAGEKLTGIDPEAIAREVAASLGLNPAPAAVASHPAGVMEAGALAPSLPATESAPRSSLAINAASEALTARPLSDPRHASEAQRLAGLASYARWAVA